MNPQGNDQEINSKNYWEARFVTDWEAKNGRSQTKFFSQLAVDNLPDWFNFEFKKNKMTICDWGCAEGDGSDVLTQILGTRVVGVDFSQNAIDKANKYYPSTDFIVEDWVVNNNGGMFDVVFSSNTLEHFLTPWEIFRKLTNHAKKLIILLLPYREFDRIEEHEYTFDSKNIPVRPDKSWTLIHSSVFDTSTLNPTYWNGQQILLIFGHSNFLEDSELTLSDLNISHSGDSKKIKEEANSEFSAYKNEKEIYIEKLKNEIAKKDGRISILENEIKKISEESVSALKYKEEKEIYIAQLLDKINKIESSVLKLPAPARAVLRYTRKFAYSLRSHGVVYTAKKSVRKIVGILNKDNKTDSTHNAQNIFNPYELIKPLKDLKFEVIDKDYLTPDVKIKFSCVTTIKNEGKGIGDFLESIRNQCILPDELIIIDGGSTDTTVDEINRLKSTLPFPIILREPGEVNIAQGRNIGIKLAKHEIILLIDAGCQLKKNFIANMVGPFSDNFDIDLVGGIYHPIKAHSSTENFIPDWEGLDDWSNFLPSARAICIRKSLWQKANGFPEYLTLTGEDTFFDIQYRRLSRYWLINKKASVFWSAPTTTASSNKLAYRYGYGDGESGYGDFLYYKSLISSFKLNFGADETGHLQGYLDGRKNRAVIEIERRKINGVVLILSGVPFTDSGGGQRCSQLAMAFIRNNYKVIFVNIYPSFEEKKKIFFDIDYSLVEFYGINEFSIIDFIERYKQFPLLKTLALMEFPHPIFLPIVKELKDAFKEKAIIAYDYIDNWRSSLGWEWYTEENESAIVSVSDVLVASAKTLQVDLQDRFDRPVELIPNAVNDILFDSSRDWQRPVDIPSGNSKIVMYIGALWGEWFDWDLLAKAADALKDFNFVMIGGVADERKESFSNNHSNVYFLGLKEQKDLPAYLNAADVCIIPFTVDHITKFVNPLKVYEYLAMGRPVVASSMPELMNIPGVVISENDRDFVTNIVSMADIKFGPEINAFVKENNWESRIKAFSNISHASDGLKKAKTTHFV